MSEHGTSSYDGLDVPGRVAAALDLAHKLDFRHSCLPGVGRLLMTLAAGVPPGGVIAETGTGCGIGLAWLLEGSPPDVSLVTIEHDERRARAVAALMAEEPRVEVRHGDALDLLADGPFDLLVLDGGPGSGKHDDTPVDPTAVLTRTGVLVIDDFTPMRSWPPRLPDGTCDEARLHWLTHADLMTTEVVVGRSGSAAVLIARAQPPAAFEG